MPLILPDTMNHALVSAIHKATGLTPGEVLTALTATTFGFQAADGGGVVEKAIDHTWAGNNANDREIDLADDYDFLFIFLEGDISYNVSKLFLACAFRDTFWTAAQLSGGALRVYNHVGGAGNDLFQGKMTGGDVNKILLGATGSLSTGTNQSGKTYRLIGWKFSSME